MEKQIKKEKGDYCRPLYIGPSSTFFLIFDAVLIFVKKTEDKIGRASCRERV